MAVATNVDAPASAATTDQPRKWVAPEQVQLQEIATKIVAHPLRPEDDRHSIGDAVNQPHDVGHSFPSG